MMRLMLAERQGEYGPEYRIVLQDIMTPGGPWVEVYAGPWGYTKRDAMLGFKEAREALKAAR